MTQHQDESEKTVPGAPLSVNSLTPDLTISKRLHQDGGLSVNLFCKTPGISKPTFYRYLGL